MPKVAEYPPDVSDELIQGLVDAKVNAESFKTIAGVVHDFRRYLLSDEKSVRYSVGFGFDSIDLGPNRIVGIAAGPGVGKTALLCQWAVDLVLLDESLVVTVANVEMRPDELIARMVARCSGISLGSILKKCLTEEELVAVQGALDQLELLRNRIVFPNDPHSLLEIKKTIDGSGSKVVFLDYLQKIRPSNMSQNRMEMLEDAIAEIRRWGMDEGLAIVAVSSMNRESRKGTASTGTSRLTAFNKTSDLEYSFNSAYILDREKNATECWLRCEKARDSELIDIQLDFDGATQSFTPFVVPDGLGQHFSEFDPGGPL